MLLVSLQAALGNSLKTSFSRLQNAVISRTSLDLGDPEKLTKRERQHISQTIKCNRKLTREQATIDQYLRMMEWLAKRRPKLTPERTTKRGLRNAKTGLQRNFNECPMEKSDDAHQVWVSRTPPENECLAPKKRAKEVWGCFRGGGGS